MQITFELPEEIAHHFATDAAGLSRAAVEALVVEGVRSRKLSTGQARRALGLSTRMQADEFLKERGVYLPLTVEDVERDADLSRRFREQWSLSQTHRP
jgi:predicted HTH domain antitoxin